MVFQQISLFFLLTPKKYTGSPDKITSAYIRAIQKDHKRIKFLGHPNVDYFPDFLDMKELAKAANDYGVALEFNCAGFVKGRLDLRQLETLLVKADRIYVNSDAHTLSQMKLLRLKGFEYLRQQGLIE